MQIMQIEREDISVKYIIGLMFLAYMFSFLMRMIWVFQFGDTDSFHWNDQLMINTNDGYVWATSTLNELTNDFNNNPRIASMYQYGVIFFTYLAVKVLPFSLDTIILFMPAVVSSLVVIPIIMIGVLFNAPFFGFFASLIGAIGWSYYNRTMTGYYDTDMFAAMAPMFVLYFLMNSIQNYKLKSALYASLAIIIYPFLYDQGKAIVFAMAVIYFVYLIIFHVKEENTYKSIILVSLATLPFDIFMTAPLSYIAKVVVVITAYFLLQKGQLKLKQYIYISFISVILFLYFGNVFSLILNKVLGYLARDVEQAGLAFFQVNQTVREAGIIPFSTMANRISGSTIGVIISLIGYILLVVRYRPFILALPLIGIGVFSLWGGLRFTVYAVPIAAISAVFLFYIIANYINDKKIKYLFIAFATGWMLYPNIKHIIAYKVPTVFMKDEVQVLNRLKGITTTKDYTIAWWDYGYPIWYYSGTNTLIDGGKHGRDNFIVSKILNTTSQTQAANLSRLAIETYESSEYKLVANTLFKDKNPNDLLDELESDEYKLPTKTRDIYLYLPNRMLNILPTVGLFSNIDLVTGIKGEQPFFYKANQFKDDGKILNFGNGIRLEKKSSTLHLGQQSTQLKRFVIVGYDEKQKLQKNVQTVNPNAALSVIYMQSYNSFLILDEKMYNSLFIKMFVLEEYEKDLFEAVILSPYAKVYKLKK